MEDSKVVPQKIKKKIELSRDSAILLLGIYLIELKTRCGRDICASMCIAALFTIAKTWKLPKYALMMTR